MSKLTEDKALYEYEIRYESEVEVGTLTIQADDDDEAYEIAEELVGQGNLTMCINSKNRLV